jgi:hypothetical protein
MVFHRLVGTLVLTWVFIHKALVQILARLRPRNPEAFGKGYEARRLFILWRLWANRSHGEGSTPDPDHIQRQVSECKILAGAWGQSGLKAFWLFCGSGFGRVVNRLAFCLSFRLGGLGQFFPGGAIRQ